MTDRRIRWHSSLVLLAGLLALPSIPACENSGTPPSGGDEDDTGDGTGTTDADGDLDLDTDSDSDADLDSDSDSDGFDECTAVTEVAGNTYKPVDIIFVIDNSPSMEDELTEVRANMNRFSEEIASSGLDHHIVLISCLPGDCEKDQFFGICIDPPLGAPGGCDGAGPYDDNNPPRYLHISDRVPSNKGPQWIIDHYDDWKGMIRTDTTLHIVSVTDDNSEWSAQQFNDALLALDPGFADYIYHGIFSFLGHEDACAISASEPCCTYAAPDGEGTVYKDLVQMTGGVASDLCLQEFDPVFDAFADSVITNAKLSCEWTIPEPPQGETLDSGKVNVKFIDGSNAAHLIGHVNASDQCGQVEHGWYYDNPSNPTKIIVCPQTCDWIQSDPDAAMNIEFGCETEDAELE